jgi:predicted RNase H-like HicB family nuclease
MSNALHLTIRYEDAGDGWLTAQVAEVPGAISEGKTREEARANVTDALDVLLTPRLDQVLPGTESRAAVVAKNVCASDIEVAWLSNQDLGD